MREDDLWGRRTRDVFSLWCEVREYCGACILKRDRDVRVVDVDTLTCVFREKLTGERERRRDVGIFPRMCAVKGRRYRARPLL